MGSTEPYAVVRQYTCIEGQPTRVFHLNHALTVFTLIFGLTLAAAQPAFGASNQAAHSQNTAIHSSAAVTRSEAVKTVRQKVRGAFKLRTWHRYSNYIEQYRGSDIDALSSLSTLDHGTAIGNTKSGVRIIVYANYECPYCKRFETETSAALRGEFRSRAQFIYRFFPPGIQGTIAHNEEIAGACIARIIGPDAFRHFTSEMFATAGGKGTDREKRLATLSNAVLRDSKVELDQRTLTQDYDNCTTGKMGVALLASNADFKGLIGTPTVFVLNTSQRKAWWLAGAYPTWVFEALIRNVIAGKPGNSDWGVKTQNVQITRE